MLKLNTPHVSDYCGSSACVQVTLIPTGVRVQHSEPGGPSIVVTTPAWRSFAAALKVGQFT